MDLALGYSAIKAWARCEASLRNPVRNWFFRNGGGEPDFESALPRIIAGHGIESVACIRVSDDHYRLIPSGQDNWWFSFEIESRHETFYFSYPVSEILYGPTMGHEASFTMIRRETRTNDPIDSLIEAEKKLHVLILNRLKIIMPRTINSMITFWGTGSDVTTTQDEVDEKRLEAVDWLVTIYRVAQRVKTPSPDYTQCMWCDWIGCPFRQCDKIDPSTPAARFLHKGNRLAIL